MAISYNSNFNETMPFSDVVAQVNCGASVEQTFTVPGTVTTKYQAFLEYASNSNVFVCLNGVPTIPGSGSVGTQQYNEFKPKKRYVRGGDVLHFITPDATAYIGVSLRQIPGG
jgi:hypothetical protein